MLLVPPLLQNSVGIEVTEMVSSRHRHQTERVQLGASSTGRERGDTSTQQRLRPSFLSRYV